jgi:hypothetical protein
VRRPRFANSDRILTAAQERVVRRAIANGATRAEAAADAGVPVKRVYRALHGQLSDLPPGKHGPRPGVEYPPQPEFVDIPVEEIYRRAAELRAERWSEDETQTRWNPRFTPLDDA